MATTVSNSVATSITIMMTIAKSISNRSIFAVFSDNVLCIKISCANVSFISIGKFKSNNKCLSNCRNTGNFCWFLAEDAVSISRGSF